VAGDDSHQPLLFVHHRQAFDAIARAALAMPTPAPTVTTGWDISCPAVRAWALALRCREAEPMQGQRKRRAGR
jgi:hypothetical protein